ncbi:MAG: hypothetical protein U5Q44_16465 [Dehalococcoidia bacterium]|nr:hypothetical protein [Dehalococcoidia bacterium]
MAGIDTEDWPDLMFETPDRVVQEALSAARSRRALTVPGVAQKVTMVGNRFVPRFASRKLAGLVAKQASMSSREF